MKFDWQNWNQLSNLSSISYICGFCGDRVGSASGYFNMHNSARIFICTNCGCPSFFFEGNQYPGPLIGRDIQNLPPDISEVYRELRDSIKNADYTAAQLLGRKLIMHLAVNVAGAKEGDTFINYVTHLKNAGYVPPNSDSALEYMRTLGNETNHEIKIGTKEQAEKIIKFVEMLLIFMYELPNEFPEIEEKQGGEINGSKS